MHVQSGFVISKCDKVTIFSHITNITVHKFKQIRCMRFTVSEGCLVKLSLDESFTGIYWKKLYHILYIWTICFLNISYKCVQIVHAIFARNPFEEWYSSHVEE